MRFANYAVSGILSLSSLVGCTLKEIGQVKNTDPQQLNLIDVNPDEKTVTIISSVDIETTSNVTLATKAVEVAKYVIAKNNGVGELTNFHISFEDRMTIGETEYYRPACT